MPTSQELRKQLTDQILKALDEGVVPWRRPWNLDPACGRPTNAVSGKPYTGGNILTLGLFCHTYREEGKYFATYKQWQSLGGQVMARPAGVPKGKWGAKAILFKPVTKKRVNQHNAEVVDNFCIARQFKLFNIFQVQGDHLDHLRPGYNDKPDPDVSYLEADELIKNAQIDIFYGGNRAFYEPGIDAITMPHRHQFDGAAYYETLFHEVAHWAQVRVDRQNADDPNSYARNELTCEMASCFVCAELGIPLAEGLENHAAYVGGWKIHDAVESQPNFVLQAATSASNLCDYILSFRTEPAEEPAIVV